MTQDNPHLGKRSTTTGTYGEHSEFMEEIKRAMEFNMHPHRTQVLAGSEFLFRLHCRSHGYLRSPRGASKDELYALARAHEAEFANA